MSAPLVRVESASTTPNPAGGVVLLVRTEVGIGRLHFSDSLARQLFVVTNRPEHRSKPVPNLSEQAAAGELLTKPSGGL